MSTQTTRDGNREQLQELLRDLFQFDAADLDFGVYRILNQRRDRIERFIEQDLLDAVDESLESLADAKRAEIEEELEEKAEELRQDWDDDIFNPDGSLKEQYANLGQKDLEEYQELWETREDVAVAEETEARIFNDLYRFFSRYYEDGDFHTKRRISSKDSKYYVPYNGEETYFHWANNDQYYVKTGEHFTDYRFDAGEWTVEFRLEEADVPQDNVKGDSRYFMLGRGDPVATDSDEQTVTIQFQYRQITEDEADDYVAAYNEATGDDRSSFAHMTPEMRCDALEGRILGYVEDAGAERILTTEKDDATSTVLKSHLTRYVSENTMDYFVHKDLQEFLEGELEFFLQNEVLDVDELIKADDGSSPPVLRARTVRKIAERIISFLAQIEDFQKRLFEKKKFVTQTDYMVTLDKVPNRLYEAILENEEQLEQWHDVYNTDEWQGDLSWQGEFTEAVLNDNPHLMIDTALFDDVFKQELLASFDDIEEAIDGTLIHGENFQGANLLKKRFRGLVDCVYVDPPYNTDSSPILYKNNYKNSSWLSLIEDRIRILRSILTEQGIMSFAIDDEQLAEARLLLGEMFDKEVGFAVVRSNPQSRKTKGKFSPNHEYALFYGRTNKAEPGTLGPSEKKLERYPYEDEKGRYAWMNFIRTGSNDLREDRPKLYYPIVVNGDDQLRIPEMSWSSQRGEYVIEESISSDEQVVYPVVEDGGEMIEKNWQRGPDRVREEPNEYRVRRDGNDEINIDFKTRMDAEAPPTTWWDDNEYASANYGAKELKRLFGSKPFDFPKATKLVEDCIRAAGGNEGGWVLDPFAGSGTTASAVARINREEEANLKYILIEMGDHFDTVIRPRIQKLALSLDWDDGVPVERGGQTHLVKYHRLESYEDALNNIALSKSSGPLQEYLEEEVDDYTSGYMLDFESRESASLLPEGAFDKPFSYELKIEQNGTSREQTTVDLVETFHYLIGAIVRQYWHETHQDRKYVVTECEVNTESGVETVLTAWRPTEDIDYDKEKEWFDDKFDSESYDRVYVNGESQIAQAEPLEITFREKMEESPNVA